MTTDQIAVERSTGIYTPNVGACRARTRAGLVYLFIDDKPIELHTPDAHKLGFAMVKQGGEAMPQEFIVVKVNGVALNFPPKSAKQVGAAILRRADAADDFQKRISK